MFKKEMICMAGYVLIRRNSLYDSALHDLVSFPVYSKPAIDKNYMLSIFMLSGSIQFYFNIQFNLACINH